MLLGRLNFCLHLTTTELDLPQFVLNLSEVHTALAANNRLGDCFITESEGRVPPAESPIPFSTALVVSVPWRLPIQTLTRPNPTYPMKLSEITIQSGTKAAELFLTWCLLEWFRVCADSPLLPILEFSYVLTWKTSGLIKHPKGRERG